MPSAAEQHATRNCKGEVTQNCLAVYGFDLLFMYILSGWEGSASDVVIYTHARQSNFTILKGKYYLADAGFGGCNKLLVPFCGAHYHLAEWGNTNIRYVRY